MQSTDTSTIGIIVGGLVTVMTGFYAIAKIMLAQATKDREADRKERLEFQRAIKDMAHSSRKVAEVTETGMGKIAEAQDRTAVEAKERNGHLAELIVQQGTLVQGIADAATQTIIDGVSTQHIEKMTVEHQVIKDPVVDRRKEEK